MFSIETYTKEEVNSEKILKTGLILIQGSGDSLFNYPANIYAFKQNSTFWY